MSELTSPWETFRQPITSEDPHFVECQPDIHVSDLLDLSSDMIAGLGVKHIFVDFDGTMAANGNIPPIAEPEINHLRILASDPSFTSFAIATDNRASYMESVVASIGHNVKLFQPNETPNGPIMKFHTGFWRRLLFETGIWDTPELAVMVGDSMRYDIVPAHEHGMKAILVDRMEKRMAAHLVQRLADYRAKQQAEG